MTASLNYLLRYAMPHTQTTAARITAIQATVGPIVRSVDEDFARLGGDPASLERIRKTIGLARRRVVAEGTTALDLGEAAARKLDLTGVDGLIFITQTPDHFQPGNAALLHGRLGLDEQCAVFDVNQGCSGWVYGVYLAHLMVAQGGCHKVLVVAGDTLSRCVHPMDRASVILFGDAASATLVEASDDPCPAWFLLRHRGAQADAIVVPAGAFRERPSPENEAATTDEDGNTRTPRDLAMKGGDVFNFTLRDVPPLIVDALGLAGIAAEEVDAFVLHQANRYLVQNVARRAKLPKERVPVGTVEAYGNVSSSSIPVALAHEVAPESPAVLNQRVLTAGFGVGLSWAAAVLELRAIGHCQIGIYGE